MLSENKKECIAGCKRILKDVSVSKIGVYCVQDRFIFIRLQQHCRAHEYSNQEELSIDAKRSLSGLEDLLFKELNMLLEHCRAVILEGWVIITS